MPRLVKKTWFLYMSTLCWDQSWTKHDITLSLNWPFTKKGATNYIFKLWNHESLLKKSQKYFRHNQCWKCNIWSSILSTVFTSKECFYRIWLDKSINIKRAKLVFCLSLTLWRTRREIESRKRHIVEHKMVQPFSCAESCKERRWCAYPISKMAPYLFWIHTWLCIYLSAAHNATHSYTTLSEWLKWAFIFFWATYVKETNPSSCGSCHKSDMNRLILRWFWHNLVIWITDSYNLSVLEIY